MTIRRVRIFLLMCPLVLGLGACQKSPDAAPIAPASSAAKLPNAENLGLISVSPESLTSCSPDKVTLTWDLRGTHPNVKTIDIYAGEGASAKLFTEGGPSGKSMTGPWAHPGTVFTLTEKVEGKQLDRVRIDGPNCPA